MLGGSGLDIIACNGGSAVDLYCGWHFVDDDEAGRGWCSSATVSMAQHVPKLLPLVASPPHKASKAEHFGVSS